MKRVMRYLSRFRRGAPPVRRATGGDAPAIVKLALAFCRERGRRIAPEARTRFLRFVEELLASERTDLLVTEEEGRITGMVCGQLTPPDLWDDRPVFLVDWLYVVPERRGRPHTALALLRGSLSCLLARKGCLVRLSVEANQPHLRALYERAFGFVPERTSHVMNLEEG